MRSVKSLLGLCVVFLLTAALSADDSQWKQRRSEAAHRRRRIIFNNDGDDAVYYIDVATPEKLLECRTTSLVGTQVDTIFYCTWCSGFSNFTHRTQIGSVFTCKEEKLSNNKVDQFIAQGTDPLHIMVEFCRAKEIEIFWSFRMNDTHDVSNAWYGPLLFPQLKKDHPEWLLGSRRQPTKKGGWTGVDYGRPEIRDLAFRFVEEVCRNYHVDGVELDFFRHLNYFKGPAYGQDASSEELDQMTGLIRRIRKMLDAEGKKRGRPILLAVRLPDSVGFCRAMGFDLNRWLEEDLLDLMVVTGYFRLNPWEVSVELGHQHGVPVYPCLSESRLKGDAGTLRQKVECYRGRAENAWDAGVDGIYLFNSFDPHSPLWSELGDRNALASMDKLYTTGARTVRGAGSWLAGGTRFATRGPVLPESPISLVPGKATTVELRVGREVSQGRADGIKPAVQLRLRLKGLSDPAGLTTKLNGELLSGGSLSESWLDYSLDPALLAEGVNRFEFTLLQQSADRPVLEDLLLWTRFAAKP